MEPKSKNWINEQSTEAQVKKGRRRDAAHLKAEGIQKTSSQESRTLGLGPVSIHNLVFHFGQVITALSSSGKLVFFLSVQDQYSYVQRTPHNKMSQRQPTAHSTLELRMACL